MNAWAWTMLVLQYLSTVSTAYLLARGTTSTTTPRDRVFILTINLALIFWGTLALAGH